MSHARATSEGWSFAPLGPPHRLEISAEVPGGKTNQVFAETSFPLGRMRAGTCRGGRGAGGTLLVDPWICSFHLMEIVEGIQN